MKHLGGPLLRVENETFIQTDVEEFMRRVARALDIWREWRPHLAAEFPTEFHAIGVAFISLEDLHGMFAAQLHLRRDPRLQRAKQRAGEALMTAAEAAADVATAVGPLRSRGRRVRFPRQKSK
jgi:hypothetical protein